MKREVSIGSVQQAMPPEDGPEYKPPKKTPQVDWYGGYNVRVLGKLGSELTLLMPDVPAIEEMGVIDIRALTLSLQSGIHSEVRLALDHLTRVSAYFNPSHLIPVPNWNEARNEAQPFFIDLTQCEDLAEVLIDCAEEQIDILAEEAAEVSDSVDLLSYEDVLRSHQSERMSLQDVSAVGTVAYELDRAADRLLAITCILRNFSYQERNHNILASSLHITFFSNAIRLLGTRNMLLRTFENVSYFYKDLVTILSNISGKHLTLPTRDDALHLLHFILAFAPQPRPYLDPNTPLKFTPFDPIQHRYLHSAIDTFAKLLALQDPNRAFFRSIFTSHSTSSAANLSTSTSSTEGFEVLTRAFALAICVLPDRTRGHAQLLAQGTEARIILARSAHLAQGMIAADILASMIPTDSAGSDMARMWLESEDRWVTGLLRMTYTLAGTNYDVSRLVGGPGGMGQKPPGMSVSGPDSEVLQIITHRGLGMLKRLLEKAGVGNNPGAKMAVADSGVESLDGTEDAGTVLKVDALPLRETVVGALNDKNTDGVALKLLCQIFDMVG